MSQINTDKLKNPSPPLKFVIQEEKPYTPPVFLAKGAKEE